MQRPVLHDAKSKTQLYVIAWVNTVRDGAGRGRKAMPLDEAVRVADELNQDYPEFCHWIEPLDQ